MTKSSKLVKKKTKSDKVVKKKPKKQNKQTSVKMS